ALDLDDRRVRGVPLDRLDAVLCRALALVGLAGGDDLAVARLEAEAPLARPVLVQLELARHRASPESVRVRAGEHRGGDVPAGAERCRGPGRMQPWLLRSQAGRTSTRARSVTCTNPRGRGPATPATSCWWSRATASAPTTTCSPRRSRTRARCSRH